MHKSICMEFYELSIVQPNDNYLKENEKLKFYDQCKKTIKKKNDVANLGMLCFINYFSKKKIKYNIINNYNTNC